MNAPAGATPASAAAQPPTAAQTLAAVDSLVEHVLDDLATAWYEVAGREADVLGAHDLPHLVRQGSGGGKRIRPEMAHWGWVAAGAPAQAYGQVVELGAAIELLHLFALVHDDVMDRSERRRGRPTAHVMARDAHRAAGGRGSAELFGDSVAILAGDLVQSEADQLVAGLPLPVRRAWRRMMVELVLGQRRDLTGAALGRRDLEHAREVARLKSGAYTVAGPLRMGALLGGAGPGLLDVLDRYAHHAGEAFGLRDDLLGTWGDPAYTGKSDGDDLAAGKATVVLALAHDMLDGQGRDLLARVGSLDATGQARLRDELDRAGVREAVEQMVADEVGRACAALDPAVVGTEAVSGLTGLTQRIAWRAS